MPRAQIVPERHTGVQGRRTGAAALREPRSRPKTRRFRDVRCFAVLAAGLALTASPARAVPPDARLVLAPGAERFLKVQFAVVAVVSDSAAVRAEVLPAGEVFLQASGEPGAAVVLAAGASRVFVWDVCVSATPESCPAETRVQAARAACPDLADDKEDGAPVVKATIRNAKCLDALRSALSHSTVPLSRLRLVMEEDGLRALIGRVVAALAADPATRAIAAGFSGPTLRLSGPATREAYARALLLAWREIPGALSVEDATREVGAPDAGR